MSQIQDSGSRWKDLYIIAGITQIFLAVLVVLAIVAFFIWPYVPGSAPVDEIFQAIQESRLAGLAALDFSLLVGILIQIPVILALYVSLKEINESYALLALALGMVCIVAVLPARPVIEVIRASEQYMAASSDAARSHYLAVGESLLAVFHGTSWAVSILFMGISYLIFCVMMLRSQRFMRITAITGIITNAAALGFVIPVVDKFLLLISTFLGIVLSILMAIDFLRMVREHQT